MKPTVEELIEKSKNWKEELAKLRSIVLDCGLTEEVKWYQPCYSFNGSNLIILGSFKDFCTLSFFKGVLLKDEYKILEFAGQNTQSAKIVKFTNLHQINELEPILKEYIKEMIALEKSGAKVTFKTIERSFASSSFQFLFLAISSSTVGFIFYFSHRLHRNAQEITFVKAIFLKCIIHNQNYFAFQCFTFRKSNEFVNGSALGFLEFFRDFSA